MGITHKFVSGVDEVVFGVAPERGYEPKIAPSLEWQFLPSGVYRCLDDGATYDAHDAQITIYVTSTVLAAWEAFYVLKGKQVVTYVAPDGVLPFGPHIPIGDTGVDIEITDWADRGRVGITADLWQLDISMRLQESYTPTIPAGVPALFGKKYAAPTWTLPSIVHLTDDGRSAVTSRTPESQTCQVVADNFDATTAASIVNWALYARGSSFTYAPPAGLYPFGPSIGDGPFTARLIAWTIQKPTPQRWDFTFTLARE
jgi:hypothetical protein